MGNCKMAQFVDGKIVRYSCDYIRENHYEMKKRFREENCSPSNPIDLRYIEFAEALDRFLNQCNCHKEELQCQKCSKEDHKGYFCRCEGRNINLAKQLRMHEDNKGQSCFQSISSCNQNN